VNARTTKGLPAQMVFPASIYLENPVFKNGDFYAK
jgi:hypothetical protein